MPFDRSFNILLESTLNSLKRANHFILDKEATHLLSKPELLALVKSFRPEDSTELLLVLQHLIGFFWTAEKLSKGCSFESFANLSFRASDLLIRYRTFKIKKALKNDIPHEPPSTI